jgi:hypothetical protein
MATRPPASLIGGQPASGNPGTLEAMSLATNVTAAQVRHRITMTPFMPVS